MKLRMHISVVVALIFSAGCSRTEDPAVLLVYHEGREYQILDRGDAVDQGEPAYFVRYYTQDMRDEDVRQAEQKDLLSIIARHIDTNEHRRVTITAVDPNERLFGLLAPREDTVSLPVQEVLQYHPGGQGPEGK